MSRIAATTVACLMFAAFTAASAGATQDYSSPDARSATVNQDYRSADARPATVNQDYRSADARPAGAFTQRYLEPIELRRVAPPVALRRFVPPAPSSTASSSGFDWALPALGAALMLVAVGGIFYAGRRRKTLTAA